VLVGDPGKALHAGLSSSRPAERDWCTGESGSYAASMNALILPKALQRCALTERGALNRVWQSPTLSAKAADKGGAPARPSLVSGHDFSRAVTALKITALAAAGRG